MFNEMSQPFWYKGVPGPSNPLDDYVIYDDNHHVIGIRDDTPEDLIPIWEDYLENREEYDKVDD